MTWRQVAIKHVALVRYGLGQPPKLSDDGIPIIRATNISQGAISTRGLIFAQIDDLPLDRAPLLRTGEVLVVRSGAYTGDSAMITEEWAGSVPGYDLRVTPNRAVYPPFLGYSLRGAPVLHQVEVMKSRAAQPHLNAEDLGELSLGLPTWSEQRRIADFLDAETARIDGLVELQKSVRERALERREVQVVAEVVGTQYKELRASSIPWVNKIPADWTAARVGLLARMGSGHTPSRSHPEWWVDCDIPWITTGEVGQVRDDRRETLFETREKISRAGLVNSSAEIHPAGTVVLCRTASAGYSAVMGVDMATSQDFATWTCGPRLDPYYLLWCLRAMRRDLLGRLAMGSTHKTIYVPDLQMLKIPLPGILEQREIVQRIRERNTTIDNLVDAIDGQLALLAERRQALITAAVTGQIDVTTARGVDVS